MTSLRRLSAFGALLLALTLPLPAFAAPSILRLDRKKAPPGSVVIITGRGFIDDIKKITVTLGDKPCMVTEAAVGTPKGDQIMVVTPLELKVGQYNFKVTIKGESAEHPFEIIDPKDLGKVDDGANPKGNEQLSKLVRVETLSVEPGAAGKTAVRVAGKTEKMADGLKLSLVLKFGDVVLKNGFAEVKDNAFSVALGPFTGDFFPGAYTVEITFPVNRQPRRVVRKWAKTVDKSIIKEFQDLKRVDYLEIGDAEQGKRKAELARKSYDKLLEEADKIFQEAQDTYAATARCLFKKGRQYDIEKWQEWLFAQGFVKETGKVKELQRLNKCLSKPYINEKGWLNFLKTQLQKIKKLRSEILEEEKRYIVPRFPETNEALKELMSVLADLNFRRTKDLFERNNLKFEKRMDMLKDADLADLKPASRATVGRFKGLVKQANLELHPNSVMKEGAPDEKKDGKN